jgi:queuine/archaeosine tRNA-ribosyltransferase
MKLAEPPERRRSMLWLGQSARTTVVTRVYPELSEHRWMASLGDAIHRPRMLDTVFGPGLRQRLAITGPLMLDSGGFTLMTRGGSLTLDQVGRAFASTAADVVVSLDLPPRDDDPVDIRAAKYKQTLSNYVALLRTSIGAAVAPVLHGVNPNELLQNCEAIARIHPSPKWVCVGGLVPLLRRAGHARGAGEEARARLRGSIGLVRANFRHSKVHVLGVGSPRNVAIAFAAGADSVDSIGWRRAAGFGAIYVPGGSERFVAPRDRKRANSRKHLTSADEAMLELCNCPACVRAGDLPHRLDVLGGSYLARAAHNAWVLLAQAGQSGLPITLSSGASGA